MNTSANPEKNSYAISTGNILDKSSLVAAAISARDVLRSTTWHNKIATAAGFDGMEIWATRPGVYKDVMDGRVKGRVLSVAQSPGGIRMAEALKAKSPFKVAEAYVLPHLDERDYLQGIYDQFGDVPVVCYTQSAPALRDMGFTRRLVQPTAEEYLKTAALSVRDYLEKVADKGVSGVCFDINNTRRPHGNNRSPFMTFKELYLEDTIKEIFKDRQVFKDVVLQASSGRVDLPWMVGSKSHTIAELRDLSLGTDVTGVNQILRQIAQYWRGYVVVETTSSAAREIIGRGGDEMWIELYERIKVNLEKIFS